MVLDKILNPIIDMYGKLVDFVWWIVDFLYVRLSQPDNWKMWLIDEGWLFIIIGFVFIGGVILWIGNWISKYAPFNPIKFADHDFSGRGRYLGRKIIRSDKGGFIFKRVVPRERWDDFSSYIVYYNSGFDSILVPDEKDINIKERLSFKNGKVFNINYKGIEDKPGLDIKICGDDPVQGRVADETFFYEDVHDKMDKIEDFGEKAVRGSVEAQSKLLHAGAFPLSREFYPDLKRVSPESMQLKQEDEEIVEETDLEEDEIDEIRKSLSEMEKGVVPSA